MEFEKWKKHKQVGRLTETSFRGMFGYERDSSTLNYAYYYPSAFITFLNREFPQAIVEDVFYKTMREEDFYQKEYLYLRMQNEGKRIVAEFVFHLIDNVCELEFTYNLNHHLKWKNEQEKIMIMNLFHWMRRFVEENSRNRLSLASSSVKERFPSTIMDELLMKEGLDHEI